MVRYNTVISLAVIKSNWDMLQKDYVENFVPLLCHIIRVHSLDEVSAAGLQGLFGNVFGIRIPINSVKLILLRAKKRGYLRQERGIYAPIGDRLLEDNFAEAYERFEREHKKLVGSLCSFSVDKFGSRWIPDKADKALLTHLRKYSVALILKGFHLRDITVEPQEAPPNAEFIVSRFIQSVLETEPELSRYLENIVKGYMIANALFLPDITRFSKTFKKVDFYLDTKIILQLLGLEGEPSQKASEELVQLIYEEGGNLKIFRHTWEETIGVLEAVKRILTRPESYKVYRPSDQYLIDKGYSASDMELILSNLDRKLLLYHIETVKTPPYTTDLPIDEKELEDRLSKSIMYHGDEALQRDVSTISAICRLRKDAISTNIEYCHAILVTPNFALARTSSEYFYSVFPDASVPPCITDCYLTTLLWLKQPKLVDQHISTHVIACAYASVNPSEGLWKRYILEVEKLHRNSSISSDDYYLLLYSIEVRSMLMDITQGEDAKVEDGTVYQILQKLKDEVQKEAMQKYLDEKKDHEKTKTRLTQKEIREKATKDRVQDLASKVAKLASIMIEILFMVPGVIGIILWWRLSFGIATPKVIVLISSGAYLVIQVLSLMNIWIGMNIRQIARRIETRVRDRFGSLLRKCLGIE